MFNKDEKPTDRGTPIEVSGFIGKGMHVEGTLSFEGTARIDGSFRGDIQSLGSLHIGEGALVEGDINIGDTIIAGEVNGQVKATGRVELKAPAKVTGDIKTPTLIIGEGVIFDGNCIMDKSASTERLPEAEVASDSEESSQESSY